MAMSRQCHIAVQAAALSLGTVGAVAVWTIEHGLERPRVEAYGETSHCQRGDETRAPAFLRAIEDHCRVDGGDRCAVAEAIDRDRALHEAEAALGEAARFDHAFLRYDPDRSALAWSVRDFDTRTRVELDAFDGSVLEVSFWDGPSD